MRSAKVILCLLPIVISSCSFDQYISIAGFTQGTSYHITYKPEKISHKRMKVRIEELLAEFDQSLSTYIDSSNISRINQNLTDKTDAYLETVYSESKRIYDISDGAFDITVGPLIDAWGFGPGRKLEMSQEVIDSILQFVGMEKVRIENGIIYKETPGLRLDVNAIAQGYAVDIVAQYLTSNEIENYMVEIGGEIRTGGVNPKRRIWRIGIDKPIFGNEIPGTELQEIVKLSDLSLASSGNYRKYYEVDGKKIVHTVDPRTGYTKMSNLLSVTIITKECITADAIATTCMVLGLEDAKEFISEQESTEALFIYTDDDGLFLEWMTEGMKKLIIH